MSQYEVTGSVIKLKTFAYGNLVISIEGFPDNKPDVTCVDNPDIDVHIRNKQGWRAWVSKPRVHRMLRMWVEMLLSYAPYGTSLL